MQGPGDRKSIEECASVREPVPYKVRHVEGQRTFISRPSDDDRREDWPGDATWAVMLLPFVFMTWFVRPIVQGATDGEWKPLAWGVFCVGLLCVSVYVNRHVYMAAYLRRKLGVTGERVVIARDRVCIGDVFGRDENERFVPRRWVRASWVRKINRRELWIDFENPKRFFFDFGLSSDYFENPEAERALLDWAAAHDIPVHRGPQEATA